MKKYEGTDVKKDFNYQNMFWLFMIANVVGVLLEGVWTVFKFGRWETHVVTIWGPFCLLYGAGAVAFYAVSVIVQGKHLAIQFLAFACIADLVEYISAWMIEDGLNMRAWTYQKHFMNLQGRISLQMTVIWGIIGIVYCYYLVPKLGKFFRKIQGVFCRRACIVLTVFMIVNMTATTMCLVRWSNRHEGKVPVNAIEQFLDESYDDNRMKKIFCEWWFINEQNEFWQVYKSRKQ